MSKNEFNLSDLGSLMNQLNKAMSQAEDSLEDLDTDGVATSDTSPMGGLGDLMGSLSSLMQDLPGDLGSLGNAIDGFDKQHAANTGTMVGNPDWQMSADVRVGDVLHVTINAVFDLGIITTAWNSARGKGMDRLVGSMLKGISGDLGSDVMGQVMDQLKKGRAFAIVENVRVLACNSAGAPHDAAQTLQLSPEANIPLVMDEAGLGFEFAPILTIKNQWENANPPTFTPMAAQIIVPIDAFDIDDAFARSFTVTGQEEPVTIRLDFQPM